MLCFGLVLLLGVVVSGVESGLCVGGENWGGDWMWFVVMD